MNRAKTIFIPALGSFQSRYRKASSNCYTNSPSNNRCPTLRRSRRAAVRWPGASAPRFGATRCVVQPRAIRPHAAQRKNVRRNNKRRGLMSTNKWPRNLYTGVGGGMYTGVGGGMYTGVGGGAYTGV